MLLLLTMEDVAWLPFQKPWCLACVAHTLPPPSLSNLQVCKSQFASVFCKTSEVHFSQICENRLFQKLSARIWKREKVEKRDAKIFYGVTRCGDFLPFWWFSDDFRDNFIARNCKKFETCESLFLGFLKEDLFYFL